MDIFKTLIDEASGPKILTITNDVTHIMGHLMQARTLSSALNSIKEIVCIIDSQNRIIFTNMAFYHEYGIEPSSVLDMHATDIFEKLPNLSNLKTRWEGILHVAGATKNADVLAELTPYEDSSVGNSFIIVVDIKAVLK